MTKETVNDNDLRVVKTRENIEAVFLDLLDKEDFSRITVTQIVKACRISKGTFYYHYKDKFDLAEKMLRRQFARYEELVRAVESREENVPVDIPALTSLAESIAEDYRSLSSIHTRDFDAKKELMGFLQQRFLEHMQGDADSSPKHSYQVSRMLASIIVTEVEMIIAGEAEPGDQFIESIGELERYLAKIDLRTI